MCEVNLNGWTTAMPTTEAKGASKVTTTTITTTEPTKTDKITAVKIEAVPTRTLDKPYNGTIKIANQSQLAGQKRKRPQKEIQRLGGEEERGGTGKVEFSDEFPNQILIFGQQEERQRQRQQQHQHRQQPNMTGGLSLRRRGRPHKSSAQVQHQRNQSIHLPHNSSSICNTNLHLTATQAIGQAQLQQQYQHQFQFQQQQQQHRANYSHPEPMNLSSDNKRSSLFAISSINNKTGKNNSCYNSQIEAFKVAASLIQNTGNTSATHCNGFQTQTQTRTRTNSGLHNNRDNQRLEQIASSFHPVAAVASSPTTAEAAAAAAYIFPSQASTFQQTAPYGELLVNKVSQSSCFAATLPRSKSSLSLPQISGCYVKPATNSCLTTTTTTSQQLTTTTTTTTIDKHNGFLNDTRAATSCSDMIAHHEALQRSFANLHNLSAVASVLQQQQGGPQLHHLQNLAYIHRNATTAAGSAAAAVSSLEAVHVGNAQPIRPTTNTKKTRELRKCRKVYGMERRYAWCTQCKWKKACSRFCDRRVQAAAVAAAAVAAATSLVTGRADHHGGGSTKL